MKWFLRIAILFFLGLIVFNVMKINYNFPLLSDDNDIYTYSGLMALGGLLLTIILTLFRALHQKYQQKNLQNQ